MHALWPDRLKEWVSEYEISINIDSVTFVMSSRLAARVLRCRSRRWRQIFIEYFSPRRRKRVSCRRRRRNFDVNSFNGRRHGFVTKIYLFILFIYLFSSKVIFVFVIVGGQTLAAKSRLTLTA